MKPALAPVPIHPCVVGYRKSTARRECYHDYEVVCPVCKEHRWVTGNVVRSHIRQGRFTAMCKKCSHGGVYSPKWSGGWSLTTDGYVRISIHCLTPRQLLLCKGMIMNKAWVAEHRLRMAEKLGRPLTKNESVHHINGNREDNAPQNLRLMTKSSHAQLHQPKCGDHQTCPHCGKTFYRLPGERQRLYCGKACGAHSPRSREGARRNLVGRRADTRLNTDVFNRKENGQTWASIAEGLGCSMGTARDRYYQHVHGVSRRAKSSQKEREHGSRTT